MKLYIPTCTLNFNNILSSESISPFEFYAKRGFGNKRFYPVPANDKERVIILYSKYPRFEIEENDLENYPMVIEIETDDYKKDEFFRKAKEHDGVEIYCCYHTINLNPFHCRIYFNSYPEYSGVRSKAEQSLENKFYQLYAPNLGIKPKEKKTISGVDTDLFAQPEKDDFSWDPSYVEFEIDSNIPIDVNRDVQLDRIKGFIYCYLIGANSSVSNEVGKLKALSRKLRNTLSAVVNSPDKRPTHAQEDAILNGISKFNEIYSSIDEDTIWNKNLVESKLSDNSQGLSAEVVKHVLCDMDVYDEFRKKLPLRRVYDATELRNCLANVSPETFSRVTDNMNNAVCTLEKKENARREKYAIETLLNVKENLSIQIIDSSNKKDFYKKLICSQFKDEYKKVMEEKGVEEPLAQAYNGGMILRDLLGDNWDSNPASAYVGALLNHFQENSAFDLFGIKNDSKNVLSSFAAFCQKGDNIDRLAEYLAQTGFCNYKLAYGIYGATRGFTSLPKTFTSVLINGNKDYYQSFASNVWRMLNGVEIKDAVLPKVSMDNSILREFPIGSKIIENMHKVEPDVSKQKKIIEAVSESLAREHAVQSPKAFMDILDSFPNIKSTRAYKNLDQANFAEDTGFYTPEEFKEKIYQIIGPKALKKQRDKIDHAIELEAKRQDPKAFLYILDNFLDKSNNSYKKIAEIVGKKLPVDSPIKNKSTITPQVNTDASRVQCTNGKHFISDSNCCSFLKQFVPTNYHSQFFSDLKWFQDEYAKGEDSQYYARASRENAATIDAFERYLSKRDYGSQVQIPALKSCLYKRYVKKDNYNK